MNNGNSPYRMIIDTHVSSENISSSLPNINAQQPQIQQQEVDAEARSGVPNNNDNDVFANERDASDCGTSQQPDNALDSTFQSYGLLDGDDRESDHEGGFNHLCSSRQPCHYFN